VASEDEDEIAASVAAGTDAIAVPGALVEDPPPGAAVERSFIQSIGDMTVAERIKLALRGNREVRMFLIRDPNRMIRRFVLQNPRVGDEEIIAIAKNRSADDELLRLIGDSREWTKNYQVRISLVSNPKTPLTLSMRHLNSLNDRDMRALAKSKNVSATVANAAKRIINSKPGG
jgi:hypothetical protein